MQASPFARLKWSRFCVPVACTAITAGLHALKQEQWVEIGVLLYFIIFYCTLLYFIIFYYNLIQFQLKLTLICCQSLSRPVLLVSTTHKFFSPQNHHLSTSNFFFFFFTSRTPFYCFFPYPTH